MRRSLMFLFVAALLAAAPAGAQEKRVDVNIGGGYTAVLSEVRDHLGDGGHFNIGMTINVTPVIGIQAEYGYTALGRKQVTVPVSPTPGGTPTDQPVYADMNMQLPGTSTWSSSRRWRGGQSRTSSPASACTTAPSR